MISFGTNTSCAEWIGMVRQWDFKFRIDRIFNTKRIRRRQQITAKNKRINCIASGREFCSAVAITVLTAVAFCICSITFGILAATGSNAVSGFISNEINGIISEKTIADKR